MVTSYHADRVSSPSQAARRAASEDSNSMNIDGLSLELGAQIFTQVA